MQEEPPSVYYQLDKKPTNSLAHHNYRQWSYLFYFLTYVINRLFMVTRYRNREANTISGTTIVTHDNFNKTIKTDNTLWVFRHKKKANHKPDTLCPITIRKNNDNGRHQNTRFYKENPTQRQSLFPTFSASSKAPLSIGH